jgi:hypothetical protein
MGGNTARGGAGATVGPTASDKDKMVELRYKLQNQASSTVLCFSNYNES